MYIFVSIFSYRLLQNYEIKKNSITLNDDIVEHANFEKESLSTDEKITSNVICRSVRDLFGASVITARSASTSRTKECFSIHRKGKKNLRNVTLNKIGKTYNTT